MSLYKVVIEGDYKGLLARMHDASSWTEESLGLVHAALVAWTERALSLSTGKSAANCAALYDLIGRLRAMHGDEALQAVRPGTPSEWRGLEQVLNERLAKVSQGETQRESVLGRKHVRAILDLLLETAEGVELIELRERLGVGGSMLSQVLGMMESAQLIERERDDSDARIKLVRLTDEERGRWTQEKSLAAAADEAAHTAIKAIQHRGMQIARWDVLA